MGRFVTAAKASDIPDQSGVCVEIEGQTIALFNRSGRFFAIDDTCTHAGGPLSEGVLDGDEVECPWHMGRFNITTGRCTGAPAAEDVRSYNVRIVGDEVQVEI